MTKSFKKCEKRILSLFSPGSEFTYNNVKYVVKFAAKPTCQNGEPKTDIFVRTESKNNYKDIKDFKISYKKANAQFIENKLTRDRSEQIFGENWCEIIHNSIVPLRDEFEKRILIHKKQYRNTKAGSFLLGFKFELLRVKSGTLSGKMALSYKQKVEIYSGANLTEDKRNAFVFGTRIQNSGVAEFIFEETDRATTCQDVISKMKTIDEYLSLYPDIYFACKALNYRSVSRKYDSNRHLAVFVDWNIKNGMLDANLVYDKPLLVDGKTICEKLKSVMNDLSIKTTYDINKSNTNQSIIVHE